MAKKTKNNLLPIGAKVEQSCILYRFRKQIRPERDKSVSPEFGLAVYIALDGQDLLHTG